MDAGAGAVESDTPEGIQNLANLWTVSNRTPLSTAAQKCFAERLHIAHTVERLLGVMQEPAG